MDRRLLLALCTSTGIVGALVTPFVIGWPPAYYLLLFLWGGLILGVYSIGLTMLGQRFTGAELVSANAGFIMPYASGRMWGPAAAGGPAVPAVARRVDPTARSARRD